MCAFFCNHNYLVSVHDCIETVGNYDERLALHKFANRLLNVPFIIQINACGSLIKYYNRRILENASGYRYTLFLPSGKRSSAFTYNRVKASPPEREAPPSPIIVSKPSGRDIMKS